MLFSFLKYLSPVWYFNLKPSIDYNYFPVLEVLQKDGIKLEYDNLYVSDDARKRDLAYRAFQMGYVSSRNAENSFEQFWDNRILPIEDEYRFLRKNFNYVWVIYVLIIRLLSMHNPFKELKSFWKSRGTQREQYHLQPIYYKGYDHFESNLLKVRPLVSIIIPTLNRYTYLKDVFRDLEKQTYQNFEVIVVDQSVPFDETVYMGWNLDLRYWHQEEKALWKARNDAIQAAKGDLLLLYDDDSLVEPDWIEQHLKSMDFFQADISSGVSISTIGAKVPAHYAYFRWSDQLDTGNVLLKRIVFQKIGLFDLKFEKQRMGDGEYGLRAYLAGFRNISNPFAKRIHLKIGEGGLRQMGSWDGWRPKKFWGPRPVPSILYLFRKYHGDSAARWMLLRNVPQSIIPYQLKGNKLFLFIGSLLSLILLPIILIQVFFSWKKSDKLLIDI